ncbi:MAG: M28 family peptidase [Gemmatimonadetes bacterium]|nr:M28 family peptidase [Gemmatimonadota bacterium]
MLLGLLTVPAALAAQAPIRGFPADALPDRARIEAILRNTPDTVRLRQYLLATTEEPHHASSPGSKAVAEYALARFKEWGLAAEIEEFEALMPIPVTRHVELLAPERYVARLTEPAIPEDKDSGDRGQLPTYNAYSADGDVTGELVYINYGVPEDYEQLARLGVDVRGKIVIAKYGRSWRGIKPKVAAEHGAIACLIYSDPEDDGYYVGDVYPRGPMRPELGAQRGSVMDMPTYPGDPLTPGWGGVKGGRKLDRRDAKTLVTIPVLPISYGDALPLLRALGGPVAPNDDWKGALPITYHVGPGPARVRVHLQFDWQLRPLYNVIAKIPGATYPDQWILQGSHHDAWVNGAQDPTSSAVALMEMARSFAELAKTGWRPQRTLVFALWDGEEWGLLGSTEWGEHHADELREKAVLYLNTDSYGWGWLGTQGSHALRTFAEQVTRDANDPKSGQGALEALAARAFSQAKTVQDSTRIRERGYYIDALGSGSDYTVFLDHLTVASLNMGYGGGQETGIYHSIYDTYDFFVRFLDPGFHYGKAQAGAVGVALARLADAPVLPWSFVDAAKTYGTYVSELDSLAAKKLGPNRTDLTAVRRAVDGLAEAGRAFDAAYERVMALGTRGLAGKRRQLEAINREIYLTERDLAAPEGLPIRSWFRHTIYAPGYYTGYGVKTMPGVREAIELDRPEEARAQAAIVAAGVERMTARVRRATELLGAL